MKNYPFGIAALLAVVGTAAFTSQARTNAELRRELSSVSYSGSEVATLRTENLQLQKTAVEVAELRQDDGELAKLRVEAVELKTRLAAAERQAGATKAPTAQEVWDAGKVDQAPALTARPPPHYPPEMRQAGIEGSATIDFIVDKNGDVQNASVVSSTREEFGNAALTAVLQWKYTPGMKGGRGVSAHMQVPIVFTISYDAPAH